MKLKPTSLVVLFVLHLMATQSVNCQELVNKRAEWFIDARYWHPNRRTMNSLAAIHPELILLDAVKTTTIRFNRFRCDHGWDIDLNPDVLLVLNQPFVFRHTSTEKNREDR